MRSRAAAVSVSFAGSALLGALAGLIWAAVSPRAVLQEIGQGTAQLVNSESNAFIAADGWFCVIGLICGVLTGVLGYWIAIRRVGAIAVLALLAGAIAGAFLMLWVGENIGLATYNHQLATVANGTTFNSSLGLGAKSALVFWPLATGAVSWLCVLVSWHEQPPPLPTTSYP